MRARLVRRLRTTALRAGDEVLRLQREVTPALALSGMRDPLFWMTSQWKLLEGITPIVAAIGHAHPLVALGVEVLERLELRPAHVGRLVVRVRAVVQIAPARLAEALAVLRV